MRGSGVNQALDGFYALCVNMLLLGMNWKGRKA